MNLQAPFFSSERKINIQKCLLCEQELTQTGKLTFPWVPQFRIPQLSFMSPAVSPKPFFEGLDWQDRV